MINNLVDGSHDAKLLLEAQAHVWNHIFKFINSMSLKCAIQLGIPDAIHNHGKPITLPGLISALPVHPAKARCVPRLMRILVHSAFFARAKLSENDQEGFVLTNASHLLLKDNPLCVTSFLMAMLDPILTAPWHYMSTWFLNNDPSPFGTTYGMTLWDYAGHEPKINNLFNEAMASDARLVMSVVINECKGISKGVFEGLKSLVDVGGETGIVAKAIAQAFPHLDCFVIDLPHVVAGLQGTDNLKYVRGDMFDGVLPVDTILLKWILHDWSDEECVKILKRCKEAIKGKGGKLIIIGMVIGNQKGNNDSIEAQFFFDMLMMVLVMGQERNEKEWATLFSDAGFSDYKIIPILDLRSIIKVYPSSTI
ncbi:trans-resveratrol di-O-methyltransferase-like [Hevea brasiliensis]|uniref:trans-resveratrol di-O-methyltransferase-like n=1 Tax=Hevea brasiliensis TaxID=3981 RepID=UPI0025E0DC86|nr:trans-resveratrol di-O-methyltransferase-like [Hevea brasiliensis]